MQVQIQHQVHPNQHHNGDCHYIRTRHSQVLLPLIPLRKSMQIPPQNIVFHSFENKKQNTLYPNQLKNNWEH